MTILSINEEKIKIFALKAATLYLKWYPLYHRLATIYKILNYEHISKSKDIKSIVSWKFYRKQTMEDLSLSFNIFRSSYSKPRKTITKTSKVQ